MRTLRPTPRASCVALLTATTGGTIVPRCVNVHTTNHEDEGGERFNVSTATTHEDEGFVCERVRVVCVDCLKQVA